MTRKVASKKLDEVDNAVKNHVRNMEILQYPENKPKNHLETAAVTQPNGKTAIFMAELSPRGTEERFSLFWEFQHFDESLDVDR